MKFKTSGENPTSILGLIKESTDTPAAIGFGISTPEQAEKMSKIADGVIVGSAMVRIVAEYGKDAPEQLSLFVKSMKEKM
jgi:tryptophan synthase alpha chain